MILSNTRELVESSDGRAEKAREDENHLEETSILAVFKLLSDMSGTGYL